LGALLVVAAALGTLSLAQAGNNAPTTTYLVAARDLAPGDTITSADVDPVTIELPEAQAAAAITSIDALIDGVQATDVVRAGELIQRSDLARSDADTDAVELAIPVDPAWSLGPRLRIGMYVDLYRTDDNGTQLVVQNVRVLELSAEDSSIGGSDGIAVLSVPAGQGTADVVDAARAGQITMVRSASQSSAP